MSTCRAERWSCKPGSWDALNARRLFASDNDWGIPLLRRAPLAETPQWLAPYGARLQSGELGEGGWHFFLEDYRFERVWNRPQQSLALVRRIGRALTPDFSLYSDWPLAMQLWNTYRSRWCGAYWQAQGVTVIPTLSWSTPESYAFCFGGIERHSLVAISTVGVRLQDAAESHAFMAGFCEMVRRLDPCRVLCYGPAPQAAHVLVELCTYPTRWQSLTQARRRGYGREIPRHEGRVTPDERWDLPASYLEATHRW